MHLADVDLLFAEVCLVDDGDDRLPRAAQLAGDLLIEGRDAIQSVDHEKDHVGRLDRELHLPLRRRDQLADGLAALQAKTAGVEEHVITVRDWGRDDVARDARLVMHNRDALAREPVEETALADVRTTDDGNGARHERGRVR